MTYNSAQDTIDHIKKVMELLEKIVINLEYRSARHDESKLEEPEKSMYDKFTPMLRGSTYGSEEYKGFLKDMGEALQHHYKVNTHHPEHFKMWSCPLCESVFSEDDVPIGITDVRLCPKCSAHGAIYESALEPASGPLNGRSPHATARTAGCGARSARVSPPATKLPSFGLSSKSPP